MKMRYGSHRGVCKREKKDKGLRVERGKREGGEAVECGRGEEGQRTLRR